MIQPMINSFGNLFKKEDLRQSIFNGIGNFLGRSDLRDLALTIGAAAVGDVVGTLLGRVVRPFVEKHYDSKTADTVQDAIRFVCGAAAAVGMGHAIIQEKLLDQRSYNVLPPRWENSTWIERLRGDYR